MPISEIASLEETGLFHCQKKIVEDLQIHIKQVGKIHQEDLSKGFGYVNLSNGFEERISKCIFMALDKC